MEWASSNHGVYQETTDSSSLSLHREFFKLIDCKYSCGFSDATETKEQLVQISSTQLVFVSGQNQNKIACKVQRKHSQVHYSCVCESAFSHGHHFTECVLLNENTKTTWVVFCSCETSWRLGGSSIFLLICKSSFYNYVVCS